ncbi:MAG: hypothetical protein KC503_37620 [Myxococcales bacterium]|nr:hypothetical protein [Myxococcales bacterium]
MPKTWKGVVRSFNGSPEEIRGYFPHLPDLVAQFPLDVALAYMFSRVELAQNMTLYCGVVKLHRADATLARSAIDRFRLTRDGFIEMFNTVFGTKVPKNIRDEMQYAERVRDRVMHGKSTSEQQKRTALARILKYAEQFNGLVDGAGGFRPFTPGLRGFKGRAASLDKSTTRWILKGMGFAV